VSVAVQRSAAAVPSPAEPASEAASKPRSAPSDARRALEDAVARAQGGDVRAFEDVYRSCIGRVYALCVRLTADKSAAETLAQDAFVHAWQKLDGYRGEAAFTTWLHRLTVNLVLQDRRSTMRRRERERADSERRPTSATPHGAVDAGVDLERALAQLPERARMVLVLHDVEGYRHREIAQLMSTSEGTCKAQLHRARKMLREALS
jgi:RNA polymerase sigma-70 factor (ECF subfamily)